MRWSDAVARPPDRKLREFAAVCAVICGGLAVWSFLDRTNLYLGGAFALLALLPVVLVIVRPRWLAVIFTISMIVAFPIAWLGSLVVLATIFFGVITPLAFLLRMLGRDPLDSAPSSPQDSYWNQKSPDKNAERYLRQY